MLSIKGKLGQLKHITEFWGQIPQLLEAMGICRQSPQLLITDEIEKFFEQKTSNFLNKKAAAPNENKKFQTFISFLTIVNYRNWLGCFTSFNCGFQSLQDPSPTACSNSCFFGLNFPSNLVNLARWF